MKIIDCIKQLKSEGKTKDEIIAIITETYGVNEIVANILYNLA